MRAIKKGICLISLLLPLIAIASEPNKTLLPEEFKVYYKKGLGISEKQFKEGKAKIIPTSNDYTGVPGCYVACYSKNPIDGVYSVGDKTYLMGQIRVKGQYQNGYCIPKGFEDKDIRSDKTFINQCAAEFPERCSAKHPCSVGGQTASWF